MCTSIKSRPPVAIWILKTDLKIFDLIIDLQTQMISLKIIAPHPTLLIVNKKSEMVGLSNTEQAYCTYLQYRMCARLVGFLRLPNISALIQKERSLNYE